MPVLFDIAGILWCVARVTLSERLDLLLFTEPPASGTGIIYPHSGSGVSFAHAASLAALDSPSCAP